MEIHRKATDPGAPGAIYELPTTATLIRAAPVAVVSRDGFELPPDESDGRPTRKSLAHRHPPRELITPISPAKVQERGPAAAPAARAAA